MPNKPNKFLVLLLLGGVLLCPKELFAQITIGGDVYGGGNMGAVGTGNLASSITNETPPNDVVFAEGKTASTVVTNVTIKGGTVRTVFGGGKNGRTYGSTNVMVTNADSNVETNIGGTVNGVDWTETIHGGLFGAGDGAPAYVFGNSTVTIEAGTVYQNVYGGGNQAELGGNTLVTLQGGDLQGSVFGGARMADIKGYSEVNVDGANIKNDLVVNYVYGGNDISGTTHGVKTIGEMSANAYVHSSAEAAGKHIFIGQLYAGGNGDYHNTADDVYDGGALTMVDVPAHGSTDATTVDFNGLSKPVMEKAYLDLKGGTFGYVFGGGNFATITGQTDIFLNNTSTVCTSALMTGSNPKLTNARLIAMGLNPDYLLTNTDTYDYTVTHFNRVFGGNNKAEMTIRPQWHLTKGVIKDLYSGGNEGKMTYPNGIFLPLQSADLVVENVYGGCRKADVNPGSTAPTAETLNGHEFQADYAARVLVTAGTIQNVYGGNDVSGTVYYGTDLQILSSVSGEVYGGGNGSYIYTDNVNLADHIIFDDLYYGDGTVMSAENSVAALNDFRPQTVKSYIHVAGTSASRTIIGKVFGGGNSATVSGTAKGNIHLQLGEYVTIEDIFLGSNGAQMSDAENTLAKYTSGTEDSKEISHIDLTEEDIMATYMEGAAVACMPTYAFDETYPETADVSRLARIGSFYGGGNVGSMTSTELFDIAFDRPIIITKKLVGGCNAATVAETEHNAKNVGGFIGASEEKIQIDVDGIIFDVSNDPTELATVGSGNQGNIFGGCFESGVIEGNVKINVQEDIIPSDYFASSAERESYLANADNLFVTPLSVFGGGYGIDAIVEGNTIVDFPVAGGALKVFGGGYGGTVNGNTTVNLSGSSNVGKLYGGGFEGPITGNVTVNLDGGTAYDVIGGACNADIAGHTEVYIGTDGFPTVTNNVYGANDFGGTIGSSSTNGVKDFASKVSATATGMIYNTETTKASAYVEYTRGSVNYIFGGAKASYDYTSDLYTSHLPSSSPYVHVGNTFVNFKPTVYNTSNKVARVYGAGQGYANTSVSFLEQNEFQDQSYVLIDIPQDMTYFQTMEVFGSGDASGLGMGISVANAKANSTGVTAAAVVDLVRGQIGGQWGGAYGGSFQAGVTRRTIVNVPEGSTIAMNSLYGGAYGQSNIHTCDVYEANVNYNSEDARIHYVYGGNNSFRRTLYGFVNVNKPIQYVHDVYGLTNGTVYGGGYGPDSWSQYTEVNLNAGATVWEAYGGGYGGDVLNEESITEKAEAEGWSLKLGGEYDTDTSEEHGGLDNYLVKVNQLYLDYGSPYAQKYNANVHVYKDATVNNYCYGGGYGQHITVNGEATTSATVSGTCYIDLLGGTVVKDLYAAGTTGVVKNLQHKYSDIPDFAATATAYVKGGTARNVYGGGWEGPVGYHPAGTDATNDIPGESFVVIGLPEGTAGANFYSGIPVVRRNAYGGGEGGPVFGTATISLYNGYIGYRYEDGDYVPDLDLTDPNYAILFKRAGNIFGGGYAKDSDVDIANVNMYGGHVRGSLYGGGEIGIIGRGSRTLSGTINKYKAGETHVTMYGGHVERNVFGGGRGFNNWGTEDVPDDNTNGYIFGSTDVTIHRGEIGTAEGAAVGVIEDNNGGYGNVFGGGDIGFVYSVKGTKYGTRGDEGDEGWYYENYASKKLSEDTHVEVKVWGKALEDVTIDGTTYAAGDDIETEALNKLSGDDEAKPIWAKIDQTGVTIHNAVFAGGNVLAGTDKVMAFANTVFGNSTASVVDAFSRDLITIGSDGIGGLYGDGNLTLVDGYRELNITNYGTDYYHLKTEADASYINGLTPRQKTFYITKYICKEDYGIYIIGDMILSETYNRLPETEKIHWVEKESMINEGRYINTVQRCDFCGVKGSRLVLRGALDRAQDESEADYTNYTINRVGELSLNRNTQIGEEHGCYFGIYNVVKFLGGVTSDVRFAGTEEYPPAVRQTKSSSEIDAADGVTTYYDWKLNHLTQSNRNNGTSPNKIALASGVFLEVVKNLAGDGSKNYGPVTGVIELDLLNVSPGEGGGYVYAKNIHGVPSYAPSFADVLSEANRDLVTNRAFTYATATTSDKMETSGNFIHSMKRIVDDCYPRANEYVGSNPGSPAHYWYIRGEFYVYDQLVSAYTGAADSYSTEISIPLTMAIQGNAKLRLLNVVPGLYADPSQFAYTYDPNNPDNARSDSLSILNNTIVKTYGQGDPISYWDWYMASTLDRKKFVTDGYYCNYQITIGSGSSAKTYYPGQAITAAEYSTIEGLQGTDDLGVLGEEGALVNVEEVFGPLNEVSIDNGYVLTMDFSNPSKWDDYYRLINSTTTDPIKKKVWEELSDTEKENYVKSATFKCNTSGTYGQYYFNRESIISSSVYAMQTADVTSGTTATQAEFQNTYIAKEDCEVYINGVRVSMSKGSPICEDEYNSFINDARNTDTSIFDPAYICVSTVLVSEGDYRVLNELVTKTEWQSWNSSLQEKFQKAYFCTVAGSWGGKYYEANKNYNGVDYCQLLPEERSRFEYNYDALDLLLYKRYDASNGYVYDSREDILHYVNEAGGANRNPAIGVFDNNDWEHSVPKYSRPTSVDYTATYEGTSSLSYVDDAETPVTHTINSGDVLNNEEYEALPNDRKYYAQFSISDAHKVIDPDTEEVLYKTYIVKETFDVAGTMYNAGKAISATDFSNMDDALQANIQEVVITPAQYNATTNGKFYFCITEYQVGKGVQSVGGTPLSDFDDITGTSYSKGSTVPAGTVIDYSAIISIPNCQVNFDIQGETPIEEATLYVPVTADINALQKDRYVTAIYEYSYTECDNEGFDYETRVEKHIINIRVKFLSGTPVIGQLEEPDLILPLEPLALEVPPVQEGAFPILSGGWEIYSTESEAKRHRNGHEFRNNIEPLYFYENGYWVSYYAETRMGKTFSDPVQVKVANYQRMSDVITDANHMYINHRDNDRDPKIYISDNIFETGTDTYSSELDALHQVFDLVNGSYGTEYNTEVNGIPGRDITGAQNVDFYLTSDIEYGRAPASWETTWEPIGDDTHCFGGSFHGNGRTISGLDNSLFGKLCGDVYNTGIMGTFIAGGIANKGEGRIENCWVWTTGTPNGPAVYAYAEPTHNPTILNCYYPDANGFTESSNAEVKPRTVEDFVNGGVTYDLNRYYLEARYRLFGGIDGTEEAHTLYRLPDGTKESVERTDTETDETYLEDIVHDIKYPADYNDYVTRYYSDGDFRYAEGLKPITDDLRYNIYDVVVDGNTLKHPRFLPIYPDDYIFFGQKLTYGLFTNNAGNSIAHDWHPVAVAKSHTTKSGDVVDNSKSGLLINDINNTSENRVYRAPAYFRNGTLERSVKFNANAAFTDTYNYTANSISGTTQPHAQMTAVDFTGGNGDTQGYQGVVAGLASDFKPRSENYLPLLDYERLDGIRTNGLTQNLLAYTPSVGLTNTKNQQTHDVLVGYFRDLTYTENQTNSDYRAVAAQRASDIEGVNGHVVLQATTEIASGETDYTYITDVDHFLVDKQDFNAPITYMFSDANRMWYQRTPENYVKTEWSDDPTPVRTTKGWIDLCLPFDVEIVTTQDKGELTHFYEGSTYGHEYWLRGLDKDMNGETNGDVYEAAMSYPKAGNNEKTFTNTFLWDYYYQYNSNPSQDENEDVYQQQYYRKQSGESYVWQQADYPYAEQGTPYIVGLPDETYYEFDLSGNFEPENTRYSVEKLAKQVITFASAPGDTIFVSDTEIDEKKVKNRDGYTFKPSYLKTTIDANSYVLNDEGSGYRKLSAATAGEPFRPYFTVEGGGGGSKEFRYARAITFNQISTPGISEEQTPDERFDGNLIVTSKHGRIIVKSGLREEANVRIVNTGGALMRTFTIQPGQTIETKAAQGIYIVNKKKISVR